MTIDTSMLEIDTCSAVLANNYLHLVVPPVGTGANLHALLDLTRSAEHVHAQIGCGRGLRVVQTKDEQRAVDDVKALTVVGALLSPEHVTQSRPDLAVLCTQHAKSAFGCFVDLGPLARHLVFLLISHIIYPYEGRN